MINLHRPTSKNGDLLHSSLRSSPSCASQDVSQDLENELTSYLLPSTSSCWMDEFHEEDDFATISSMRQKEMYYTCHNYLQDLHSNNHGLAHEIIAMGISARSKICEWMFTIVDCNRGFKRETAIVAMSYLDRYMCSNSQKASRTLDLQEYSLAAMTCIYIALKMTGEAIDATSLCQMSGLHYSVEELVSFELHVLSTLQWKLNAPTALEFVRYMLKLVPSPFKALVPKIYAHSQLQTELAVGNYSMLGLNRSTIAVASVLNSISQVDFPLQQRIKYMSDISNLFGIDAESPLVYAARGQLLDSLAIVQEEEFGVQEGSIIDTADFSEHQDLDQECLEAQHELKEIRIS